MKKILMLVSAAVFAVTTQAAATEWGEYLDAPTGTYTTYTLPTSTGTITALWSFTLVEHHSADRDRAFFYLGHESGTPAFRINAGYTNNASNNNLSIWGTNVPTLTTTTFALTTGQAYIAQIVIDPQDKITFSIKESGNADFTEIVSANYNSNVNTLKINGSRNNEYGTSGITTTSLIVTPEPTSLALLALGVAALGLKRKIR